MTELDGLAAQVSRLTGIVDKLAAVLFCAEQERRQESAQAVRISASTPGRRAANSHLKVVR